MTSNLATVQAIYEAFGKGDIPFILDKVAEDVRWEDWSNNHAQQAEVPWLKPQQGRKGVLEFFQTLGTLQLNDFQVYSLMDGGHQVSAEVMIDFTVSSTGKRLRDEELHLWTFNDQGQVIRLRHYNDTAKHIAAAKA